MKTFTKTLLAACTLALASTVMAAESGTGDRGTNNQVGPQSPSDLQMSPEQYKAANKAAKDNYNTAIRQCSTMTGKELAACRADAKTARKQAIKDAREANRSMSSNDTTPTALAAPGNTPADRGERAVRRQSQAEGPKP